MATKAKHDKKEPHENDDAQEPEKKPKVEEAAPPAPPEYGPPFYRPSAKLAVIVGERPITRTRAARSLWDYIKREGLRSKDDPSEFETDDVLKDALDIKQDELSTTDLTDRIRQLLR